MTGRPQKYSDREILQLFQSAAGYTLSTPELRKELDYSQPAVWKRLKELAEDGYLVERQTGAGNSTLWTLTESGKERIELA